MPTPVTCFCGRQFEFQGEVTDNPVPCPECGAMVFLPGRGPRRPASPGDEPPKRRCPLCTAMIPVEAVRCGFCGSPRDEPDNASGATPKVGPSGLRPVNRATVTGLVLGGALLALLAAGASLWQLGGRTSREQEQQSHTVTGLSTGGREPQGTEAKTGAPVPGEPSALPEQPVDPKEGILGQWESAESPDNRMEFSSDGNLAITDTSPTHPSEIVATYKILGASRIRITVTGNVKATYKRASRP